MLAALEDKIKTAAKPVDFSEAMAQMDKKLSQLCSKDDLEHLNSTMIK